MKHFRLKKVYIVKFHVEGQYTAYVKASSYSKVSELATEQLIKADFGDIHHVHGDIDHIENIYGDIL